MIDALQQVINQLETLSPEEQARLAEEVQELVLKHQSYDAERARVSHMTKDEFAAFLAERKVSKPYLAPGYRGTYFSTEEFDEALEALTDPEEWAEYQREKATRNANL